MVHPIQNFFADKHGFQKVGTTHYYGRIDNVPVVCYFDERNKEFELTFSAVSDGTLEVSEPWLSECKDRKWIKMSMLTKTALHLSGRAMNGKKGTEQIEGLVHGAMEQLRQHGFGIGSFYSGEPENGTEVYQVNNKVLFLNEGEIIQIQEELERRKEEKTYEKENYFLGMLGALIGAIAGGILWVLIGHFGYYAWIAGIGGITLSFVLYKKFAGGRVSKVSAALVFLISIAVIFASSIVEWAWRLYDVVVATYYDVTFFDVLWQTWDVVTQTPDVSGSFFMDLLIGIGVVVVVGVLVLVGAYRENAGYYTIKKLPNKTA